MPPWPAAGVAVPPTRFGTVGGQTTQAKLVQPARPSLLPPASSPQARLPCGCPAPGLGRIVQPMLGFAGKKTPTGYGAVTLSATLNGIDLGKAWSVQPTYTEDTEHAEDSVVDLVEQIQFFMGLGQYPSGSMAHLKPLVQSVAEEAHAGRRSTLVINDLSASPCSTRRGTCKKKNHKGCAERLIEVAKIGLYTVTVNADHYYQPSQLVDDAKGQSQKACNDMRLAGITVNVANP